MKAQPMQLAAIREARAAKVSEARSLLNSANGGNLTPEAQTKFDAIKAEIVNLKARKPAPNSWKKPSAAAWARRCTRA